MENIEVIEVELTAAEIAQSSFYRINVSRMEDFMKKINRLNNKAVKMNCSPIIITTLGQCVILIDKKTGEQEIYNVVTISGEAPKFNGWTFISKLEHTIAGNIVRNVPSHESPVMYRTTDAVCDHCKSRRKRKETFVLLSDEGTYMQVGRNCIADFLGHTDPENYGKWFDLLDQATEEATDSSGGSGGERYFDLNTYMGYVVECIERFGFVSGTYAREQREYHDRHIESTSSRALRHMLPPRNKDEAKARDFDSPCTESFERAKLVSEWGKSLKDRPELNDYLHNLTVIANIGSVSWDKMSFAASMASAYQKELDNIVYVARVAKEKAEKPVSEYVGTEGVRADFTVTVKKVIKFETDYGVTKFHIMEDENRNNLVWFSSNKELDAETTYTLKATVKEHKMYENEKQTVLTRCAVQ
jgi:hypothetical protein